MYTFYTKLKLKNKFFDEIFFIKKKSKVTSNNFQLVEDDF
jgi:hypothetical protein